jgi:hypothetical protein
MWHNRSFLLHRNEYNQLSTTRRFFMNYGYVFRLRQRSYHHAVGLHHHEKMICLKVVGEILYID